MFFEQFIEFLFHMVGIDDFPVFFHTNIVEITLVMENSRKKSNRAFILYGKKKKG